MTKDLPYVSIMGAVKPYEKLGTKTCHSCSSLLVFSCVGQDKTIPIATRGFDADLEGLSVIQR